MSKPLISIIIPVFNGENFLNRCFYTLVNLNYSNLEIIFINNASQDSSLNMISKFCEKNNNSYILDCKKIGPSAARNMGIKFSNGKFISFLDVDDEIKPDKFLILLEEFSKYPNIAMAVGDTEIIYSDGRKKMINLESLKIGVNQPPVLSFLWLKQFYIHPHISSSLILKTALNSLYFPENIKYGEDIALSVMIAINNSISYSNNLVSTYHRHPNSSISRANLELDIAERYFKFYKNFALPYFYNNLDKKNYISGYNISEGIAFRILMKLIKKDHKKKFSVILDEMMSKNYIKNLKIRKLFYKYLPYDMANYLDVKLLEKLYNEKLFEI